MSFTGNNNRVDGWSYDANGNLLNDQVHLYQYDAENRLTQVDSGATASYIYNAEGARVHENVGGAVEEFLNGDGPQSLTIVDASQNPVETDYSFGRRPLATATTGGMFFAATDTLGTVRARLNASGAIVESDTSWPYGEFRNYSNAISRIHFTGKLDDTESGLDSFGARYYAASLGRFMTPDFSDDDGEPQSIPHADLTDPQSLNLYSYVENNPVTMGDPNGHDVNLACNGNSYICRGGLQGTTTYSTDANGNTTSIFTATVITSASLADPNSGNSATLNQNGVQITSNGQISEGIFINNLPAADIQGSGKLADFNFQINGNCGGKCLASGSFTFAAGHDGTAKTLEARGAFESIVDMRIPGIGKSVDEMEFHPGTQQFRFGTGPSPHFSLRDRSNGSGPTTGPFHVDRDAPGVRHLGCAWFGVRCN